MGGFLAPLFILGLAATVVSPPVSTGGEIRGSVSTRSAISAGPASAQSALTSSVRLSRGGRPRAAVPMPRITVAGDELRRLGTRFKAWGFQQYNHNYMEAFYASPDMDDDYHVVIADTFRGDRAQGANVIRLRLELWTFIEGTAVNDLSVVSTAMDNLIFALNAARRHSIYVLLNGANTVHPTNAPAWYDALPYLDRWDVQEFFWSGVAAAVYASGNSTTLLGYDLINEPYLSTDPNAAWYGIGYLGSEDHFTVVIARGPGVDGDTAREWIVQLRDAIKAQDQYALVTIGVLPFFAGPFGVENTQDLLDFLSPHLYPPGGFFGGPATLEAALAIVDGFAAAAIPNVIGEILPWGTESDNDAFFGALVDTMEGQISFSYGYGVDEFTTPNKPPAPDGNTILAELWLAAFAEYRSDFMA